MNRPMTKHDIRLRINKKNAGYWLLLVFLTLPHMKPPYLEELPVAELLFNLLRVVSFLIIMFWYVVKRKPISLVIVLAVAWRAVLVYSTFIHDGDVYGSIIGSFSVLSVMLLYDTTCNSEKTTFVSAQLFCFELVIYINFLTEVLFPNGLYEKVTTVVHTKNWFLGYYNNHSQYFIPALLFAWLYNMKTKKLLRPILLTVTIYISACLVWSGGVILSLTSMTIVFLFFKNRTRFLNYYTYWTIHIIFFVGVYIFHIQDWFHWLLVDILGKMSSLTSRIDLWERALKLIGQSPIIGHGVQGVFVRTAELHNPHGVHAHNMLLELLYESGTIGFALWVLIVIYAGKRLVRYGYTKESKIISIAFLGWCVATLVEPFTSPLLMGMFVIAHRSNRIETAENEGGQLQEVI